MITFPNAKINLGLNIVAKRPDGYHDIETIFYPIPLNDALEIVNSEHEYSFNTIGELECDKIEDNLIYKAYAILAKDFDIKPFTAYLKKHIPTGAGLGGGSADAAYMIRMINDHSSLGLTNEQMEGYAAKIGADCAFFIQNNPTFAEGIGNIFTSVNLSLKGYKLLLVKPKIHVSTKDAYAHTVAMRRDVPLREAIQMNIGDWKDYVINDFEKSVFIQHPALQKIKEQLYERGALYAAMSGSGSSLFGIYPCDAEEPNIEFDNLEARYWLTLD